MAAVKEQELPPLEDLDGQAMDAAPEPVAEEIDGALGAPEAAPELPAIDAPNTWSGAAKEAWPSLAREVQEVVAKREKEIHAGIEQYRSKADVGNQFEQAIQPYIPYLRATGEEPMQAVQNLLQVAYQMRTDPYRTTLGLIQQYGIDIGQLAQLAGYQPQGQGMEQQGQNPMLNQVLSQQQQMQSYLRHMEMQRQAAESAEADRLLSTFGSDTTHEFFNDPQVRQNMGLLLRAGLATDLKDAYDQACQRVPHVRAEVDKRQTAKMEAERTQKQKQKAADAKRATVDVVDKEDGFDPFPQDDRDDLRATLRKNLRKLSTG